MIAKLTIAALAAGMLATGGASAALTAPAAEGGPALAAFNTPLDRGHDWGWDHRDNDHGRGWDGDRRRDDDWDGHDWHWWHDWGISAELCRDGGGHVRWDWHRCDGGRFDDFHVR